MKESVTKKKLKIKEGTGGAGVTSEETYGTNNKEKIGKGKLQIESAYSAKTDKQSSPLKEITNEVDITSFFKKHKREIKNPVLMKNNELKNDFCFDVMRQGKRTQSKISREDVEFSQNKENKIDFDLVTQNKYHQTE